MTHHRHSSPARRRGHQHHRGWRHDTRSAITAVRGLHDPRDAAEFFTVLWGHGSELTAIEKSQSMFASGPEVPVASLDGANAPNVESLVSRKSPNVCLIQSCDGALVVSVPVLPKRRGCASARFVSGSPRSDTPRASSAHAPDRDSLDR
jgi:hypothetical protein